MANLRRWSSSASGNSSIAGGANTINFAEGQSPGSVNNSAREMMAQVRSVYTPDEWGWVEHSATASVASQTTFKLVGDQTSNWTANRRWRLKSGSTTRFGTIVSASYTTETTITVTVDSGSLSASHSLAALAAIDANHVPRTFVTSNSVSIAIAASIVAATTSAAGVSELATNAETLAGTDTTRTVTPDGLAAYWEQGSNIASASTVTMGDGGYFVITGTTTITALAFTTDKAGRVAVLQFAGALTLTNNATSLILPADSSITTSAGDVAAFVSEGSGNFRCLWYRKAGVSNIYGGAPDVILEDQKASGTDGGGFTSGADRTRTLNTEVRDVYNICSLAGNQFTLAAGAYYIEWSAPGRTVNEHQSFLYNATAASEVKRGTVERADAVDGTCNRSFGGAVVTIASASAFEIRHRCNTSRGSDGFGIAGGFGTEVYTIVRIWKTGA